MAAGNGNQQQNNNLKTQEARTIAGTNQPYTGLVVKLGEFEYTTVGGGIEGDRQQLEPLGTNTNMDTDTSPNNNNINNFVYLEDYDIGTGDGILSVSDVIYWNNQGKPDVAEVVMGFVTSGNMPPNRPPRNGQSNNQQNNMGPRNGGAGGGLGTRNNNQINPGGNVGGGNTNMGGGGSH